jgi:ubiquinone/menaquinone biosynthesis C-methylase UbiE
LFVFVAALVAAGLSPVCVEPSGAMRAALSAALPQLEVRAGTSREIPLASEACEAVFVGQAFHWFADIESLTEIHRVLKPGGRLVCVLFFSFFFVFFENVNVDYDLEHGK